MVEQRGYRFESYCPLMIPNYKHRERIRKYRKFFYLFGVALGYPPCCARQFSFSYNKWYGNMRKNIGKCEEGVPFIPCDYHLNFSVEELWQILGREHYSTYKTAQISLGLKVQLHLRTPKQAAKELQAVVKKFGYN